jgi:hypothetical protein
MAKFANDLVMDAAFDYVIAQADALAVASGDASGVHANLAAITLASVTIDSGDLSKANGDTNGRKLTVAQQTAISITASGTANHVHVVRNAATARILLTTTCTSQALTSGGTVTVPAWDEEIGDPT